MGRFSSVNYQILEIQQLNLIMEKVMIETKIQWNKPEEVPPPFEKEILVLVGGQIYEGGVWSKYLKPLEVKISKEGPADVPSENSFDFDGFTSGRRNFMDCQFFLNELNGDDEDDPMGGWFSDAIVLWAESPFPGLIAIVDC
ncbi:hypothetical protein [Ferrovum myxofaciens]|uniref:Uncharacterized protein n=1 Tax=Ferrovum myxofaciens TaxID=416213 RepID=A0A9E6MXZ9_9PROT|nr:hypothetical protein [Ferrovum myxofaciens]QKE37439.1 MAG: hypothetical protein HO273_00745 [Ferrovum myxofaciens]QWY75088.1 MAG: hypothetical protein JVY19_01165 [Ferrovum myxofaciens]QWY77824.1 MAG: hypothetical protein JZL65_01675 [Ferrovum myxofaciens]